MEYRVVSPIQIDGVRLGRGTIIGAEIESSANFRAMLKDKTIERLGNIKTGEEFVPGCYIVVRGFSGKGIRYNPGDFVDLRDKDWRNTESLFTAGYLKRATNDEVSHHTTHSPLDSGGCSDYVSAPVIQNVGDAPLYQNEQWLRYQYIDLKRSATDICGEIGCSLSTLSKWMGRYKIKARPRGRPSKNRSEE